MERSIMDAEQNKCCLMCFKHEKLFVQNNMQMVNRLKVIFGTRNVSSCKVFDQSSIERCVFNFQFDDTLNYGRFCVSCAGRVCQLYNFFIIAFHVSNNTTTDDFKQCFTCQRDTVIIEKDMTSEVEDFISSSRLFMVTFSNLNTS